MQLQFVVLTDESSEEALLVVSAHVLIEHSVDGDVKSVHEGQKLHAHDVDLGIRSV